MLTIEFRARSLRAAAFALRVTGGSVKGHGQSRTTERSPLAGKGARGGECGAQARSADANRMVWVISNCPRFYRQTRIPGELSTGSDAGCVRGLAAAVPAQVCVRRLAISVVWGL